MNDNRVSLCGDQFDKITAMSDAVLNHLISKLHARDQQDGEMANKTKILRVEDIYQFSGTVSGKINDTIKPQKISDHEVEIAFDEYGSPYMPYHIQPQVTFDDTEIDITVTADASGMVEKVEVDNTTSACTKTECPLYKENGCSVSADDKYLEYEDVCRAVEKHGCTRPKIKAEYEIFLGQEELPEEELEEPEYMEYDELHDFDDLEGDIA